ncbi:MAG: hypothetical protein JNM56_27715, partial [Planctomycetia bacterium]|nr:hypothetical protein [Planctomycetia bacterium]
MFLKRALGLLALVCGLSGVVLGLLGFYGVWSLGARLRQANEQALSTVDTALVAARGRVLGVQQRVRESRITTEELGKVAREWTARKATERLGTRLDVESKTEQLDYRLQQAESWLETAAELLKGARQLMMVSEAAGAPVDPALVDEGLEQLSAVRHTLQQTRATVDRVRAFTTNIDERETTEALTTRLAQLVARVLLTISEMDSRLGVLVERLAEMQVRAEQVKDRINRYISGGTLVGLLLVFWGTAGQVALGRWGWQAMRGSAVVR